jgi:hypothetical protein
LYIPLEHTAPGAAWTGVVMMVITNAKERSKERGEYGIVKEEPYV